MPTEKSSMILNELFWQLQKYLDRVFGSDEQLGKGWPWSFQRRIMHSSNIGYTCWVILEVYQPSGSTSLL